MSQGIKRPQPPNQFSVKKTKRDQNKFQMIDEYNKMKQRVLPIQNEINSIVQKIENQDLKTSLLDQLNILFDDFRIKELSYQNKIKFLTRRLEVKEKSIEINSNGFPIDSDPNGIGQSQNEKSVLDRNALDKKLRGLTEKQIKNITKNGCIESMFGSDWEMIEINEDYIINIQKNLISALQTKCSLCIVLFDGLGNVIGFKIEGNIDLNYFNEIHDVQCTLFSIYDSSNSKMNCKSYDLEEENIIFATFAQSGETICEVKINGKIFIKTAFPGVPYTSIITDSVKIGDENVKRAFDSFIFNQDNDNETAIQGILCYYKNNEETNEIVKQSIITEAVDQKNLQEVLSNLIREEWPQNNFKIIFNSLNMRETNDLFNKKILFSSKVLICLELQYDNWVCLYIEDELNQNTFNEINNKTHFIYSTKTEKKYFLNGDTQITFSFHNNNCGLFTIGNRKGFIHISKTKNKRSCVSRLSLIYDDMDDCELFNVGYSINKFNLKSILVLQSN